MSENTYSTRTFIGVGLLLLLWLFATFFLGCSHMQVVKDPNTGPASYAKPDPGRF